MSKTTISLLCLCMGTASASHSIPSPRLDLRQADGAVDTSSFLRRAYQSCMSFRPPDISRLRMDTANTWQLPCSTDGSTSMAATFRTKTMTVSYTNIVRTSLMSHDAPTHPLTSFAADTLISIDLSKDWTNSSVVLHSTSKPSGVPSLNNGGIWVDNKNNLLYTGFAGINSIFGTNTFYPQGLWSFSPDGTGGGSWENLNGTADDSFVNQPRPFDGSVASGEGSGYFLGGETSLLTCLRTYGRTNTHSQVLVAIVPPFRPRPGACLPTTFRPTR